jgi:pimeloyl-ACP methyl ester carboxylesterase
MAAPSRAVVIVHGLLVGPWIMRRIEQRFNADGYRVVNWGYPSVLGCIEDHGARLKQICDQLDADPEIDHYHLLTHSMGGIVARSALSRGRPTKLGRMVMLAPPNCGTVISTVLGPLMRMVGWRTIGELAGHRQSYVCRLHVPADVEIGVIAGSWDHLVRERSTHLSSERDHLVVPALHSGIVFRRDVYEQAKWFFERGRFRRPELPLPANLQQVAAAEA